MSRKQAAQDEYDEYGDGCDNCGGEDHTCDTCPEFKTKAEYDAHVKADHGTNKESAMRTEAQILTEMATASLADQRTLAQELDTLRTERTASAQADREVDLADTVIRSHLTPVAVHTMHTAATDWIGEDEVHEDPTMAMKTEATLWFQRTSAEVREDIEEFAIQAQGKATQLASRCGEQADVAFEAFIGHVDHLYRTAAKIAGDTIDKDKINGNAESGLPDEVDNDDTAFDDPGFLSDDDDTGVHPKMPGAEGAKTATNDAEDSQASSERENFYAGQSADADSDDEDDSDADDGFGGKKAPPFGSEDGGKTSAKTADATPDFADGDAKDNLGKPDETTPLLAEDWDHKSEDPETGKDAADVADVPTPGGDSGYPKPKNSMLDKAAAFRALVTANLER